jgi:hypothetical protein
MKTASVIQMVQFGKFGTLIRSTFLFRILSSFYILINDKIERLYHYRLTQTKMQPKDHKNATDMMDALVENDFGLIFLSK